MPKMNKRTIVYKNLKTGDYLVQPYTIGPVAATEYGEPTAITADEFHSRIAAAITENIEKFGMEQYDKTKAIRRNDKQQEEFLRNCVAVSVYKRETAELVIYALHREGGGMVGSDEDTFVLSEQEISSKLTSAIAEAFRRAT
jgi:hypothetical protein